MKSKGKLPPEARYSQTRARLNYLVLLREELNCFLLLYGSDIRSRPPCSGELESQSELPRLCGTWMASRSPQWLKIVDTDTEEMRSMT